MYFAEISDADAVQLDVQKYTFIQLKLSLQLAKKWEIGEDTPGKKIENREFSVQQAGVCRRFFESNYFATIEK